MRSGPAVPVLVAALVPALAPWLTRMLSASQTNYQETMPLVWAILIISVVGAALTFGFLLYAIVRFRDPATRGRRYG